MTYFTPNCANNSPSYNGVLRANIQYNAGLYTRKSLAKKSFLNGASTLTLNFLQTWKTPGILSCWCFALVSSSVMFVVVVVVVVVVRNDSELLVPTYGTVSRTTRKRSVSCCFLLFFILTVSILSSTQWACVDICQYLACNAANRSTVYYASAAPS